MYRYDAERAQADILAVDAAAASSLRDRLSIVTLPLAPLACGPFHSETDFFESARRVEVALEHLRAGDCYQVNLCRRLRAALPRKSALTASLRLREVAPAPLGCYLELEPPPGEGQGGCGPVLLSNTPELLLRLELDKKVRFAETRPIKGTRRRDANPAADRALARQLEESAKDRAEHLMIVDLLRNDLGRIAEVGSVKVEGFLRRVELPTVHHLVSTVTARPAPGIGLAEILHALVPGGSITGAPKVAAMQIIDALEPVRGGPFYGAVGWLSATGGELALCIRTAVLHRDELVLSVGGGIILDSIPEEEWAETEAKAAAFFRALGAA